MRIEAIALCAALVGCSVTPVDLDGEQGSRFTVEIPSTPEATYRRLVTGMRECYTDGGYRVDADYFSDVQRGRVTLGVPYASVTMAVIRLDQATPGATRMQVAYFDPFKRPSAEEQWRASVVPWARGLPGVCIVEVATRPAPQDRADRRQPTR